MDFISGHCGQTLLRLTARGSSIAAEILRLSKFIPKEFMLRDKRDRELYSQILIDFVYYTDQDRFDSLIDKNKNLAERDLQIRNEHIDILIRFYLLFESILQFSIDLVSFIEDLDSGVYIHLTIDNVLMDMEGKQLISECVYLCGVHLLLLDHHIPGQIRERLLVAYSRYVGDHNLKLRSTMGKGLVGDGLMGFSGNHNNMDDICKLMRSTGFALGDGDSKPVVPQNYPQDYFQRVSLPVVFVQRLIGRLRSDDLYQQLAIYPVPEHRSHALSTQGSMLYVTLYFVPNILHNQTAMMREIVDKFFPDNWVVHVYMGTAANLIDVWDSFKAAKLALANTVNAENVRMTAESRACKVDGIYKQLSAALVEGFLNDNYVLSNWTKLVNAVIMCNVCIRWLMLHTCSSTSHLLIFSVPVKSRKVNESVVALANGYATVLSHQQRHQLLSSSSYFWFDRNESEAYSNAPTSSLSSIQQALISLLLNTAHMEYKFREILERLLKSKESAWGDYKAQCSSQIQELSKYFSGEGFGKVERNAELEVSLLVGLKLCRISNYLSLFDIQKWFGEIAVHVQELDIETDTASARRIVQIIEALVRAFVIRISITFFVFPNHRNCCCIG